MRRRADRTKRVFLVLLVGLPAVAVIAGIAIHNGGVDKLGAPLTAESETSYSTTVSVARTVAAGVSTFNRTVVTENRSGRTQPSGPTADDSPGSQEAPENAISPGGPAEFEELRIPADAKVDLPGNGVSDSGRYTFLSPNSPSGGFLPGFNTTGSPAGNHAPSQGPASNGTQAALTSAGYQSARRSLATASGPITAAPGGFAELGGFAVDIAAVRNWSPAPLAARLYQGLSSVNDQSYFQAGPDYAGANVNVGPAMRTPDWFLIPDWTPESADGSGPIADPYEYNAGDGGTGAGVSVTEDARVPEPGSVCLLFTLLSALAGLGGALRRRQH